jgi:hypothetical protein
MERAFVPSGAKAPVNYGLDVRAEARTLHKSPMPNSLRFVLSHVSESRHGAPKFVLVSAAG